ncbi:hypothetical protein [Sphingobacterium thalpophilum]|uniref:hypothetical protein n=1 Tax=Sphingobacterium thalpophilum TaxID=259 RepID=UPI0024A76FF9|nr:hypothetical protein [Sphingobacterium thalpophilum]
MRKSPKPAFMQPLTSARKHALLCDVQFMGSIAQLLENRWRNNLFDTNLESFALRNYSVQIYRAVQGMKMEMAKKFNVTDQDELEYDMIPVLDRVVSFFCLLNAELATKIMDGLEQGQAAIIKELDILPENA